jgi:tRNA(Ile)-lysidine synthase
MFPNIEHFITQHTLIKHNDIIIIGLSGGPDSMFLLHSLMNIQQKYNLTLIAAHLNHEWRAEADSEEELCRHIAQKYNIPFVSEKLSQLQHTVKHNGSKEEYARKMRRFFLEKIAQKNNAHSIALAHHAQDQQETFFIRLIRGTSLTGLTSIKPHHGLYIRPLLETNKSDIMTWLIDNKIPYATDISNESPLYLRNRIRTTVLPALSACDSRFNNNFISTLKRLKEDDAYLTRITLELLNNMTCIIDNTRQLNISAFIKTDPALHHRLIMHWLITENVQFPLSYAFFDEILRFLQSPRGGVHVINQTFSLVKKQSYAHIKTI